ncbi:sigma 54-interacting transcriptional regulator [Telmatospirillum sp. J64-1]|uniref:sigma 54-interacting transcriptional regulator n=1 Tax=Telmatospirillum sp. J64-1 TaxID=2502183 RepID=UPI00115E9E38|nr:sigma 54-interacting transcriptional regulator [Telmatospirillum sp. J64-1]
MHSVSRISRGLFDSLPDAALVIELASGRILEVNAALCHLLGYDRDYLLRLTVIDLFRGQEAAFLVFTEAVISKGAYWTRGLTLRHADCSDLSLEFVGTLLPDAEEMLLTLYDLDARRRRDIEAEGELYLHDGLGEWQRVERVFQDIERENQLILKAAGEGIYGVNAEGKTTFVNPAAERILGWPAEELLGRDFHAIAHHHHADGTPYLAHECPIYAAFRDGRVHRVSDEVFWARDGRPVWVEYTSTPIRVGSRLVGAVIVFRDISQRREADERLRAALAEVDRLRQRLELENAYLQEEIRISGNHHGIIGNSAAVQKILKQVDLVAPTEASVLITGESGTGKELIARAIHEASGRSKRPLIRVNCAAIPRELFESEFFGHAKGAFTGAVRDRVGRFELADGGTLFLDEVGEIPLDLQGKLLRVLQDGLFERVGEERTRTVDVRIVAATNRDLRAEVEAGRFRQDLYFRLNVFPIETPPLRERPEDIPQLAAHFLRDLTRKLNLGEFSLTEGDVRRLIAYSWPGNVRELQNVMERAAILGRNGRIHLDLPAQIASPLPLPGTAEGKAAIETKQDLRARERTNILAALETAKGKISGPGGAAELLGVPSTTLNSRIKTLGIDLQSVRNRARHRSF